MSPPSSVHLRQLARLYGVQTAYYDVNHHRQQAFDESLLAILRSLGAPLANLQDVPSAWRERRQVLWQRMIEPVIVTWIGKIPLLEVRLPYSEVDTAINCHLKLDNGEERQWQWRGDEGKLLGTGDVEGIKYLVKQMLLPGGLPMGYHRLTVELRDRQAENLVISAPTKAYSPSGGLRERQWGVFIPLYALHTQRSWGAGDYSDLIELTEWTGDMGGQVIATLPLLPTFVDDHIFEPSPYLPVSRLLWNEFFLDITRVPELQDCPQAQAFLESAPLQDEIRVLRNSAFVDYQQQMVSKRKVLEELSHSFFTKESKQQENLTQFVKANPIVKDYAHFRATCEKQGISWPSWPQPLEEGLLREGDYNESDRRYHLYVQWLAHQQITDVSDKARGRGVQLYLDLPLGVHPDGYDVWREREIFIPDASAGAPPDTVFLKGQNWAFQPLHPERIREQGHRYVIACLRHHLQHAGILRIDHVMGLHRLFCIPDGMECRHGVYLRYRAEELYAILALESQRYKAIIVGEDLGTVPSYVRPAMKKHDFHRMYVVHYELASDLQRGLPPVSFKSVASLNTHDMPPFASFWQGLDIKERRRMGFMDKTGEIEEKNSLQSMKKALITFLRDRGWLPGAENSTAAVLRGCLSFLAASRARMVLINLEDLWLETRSHNIPSTSKEEYPNWRRRAQYTFEQFCQLPQVVGTLPIIDGLRKRSKHRDGRGKSA
ncbi:MAG: 4-alpha-glucanotransferase [Dehalococcoidales bacterium]|nr:MAG: 4-alpha-glucanotransferase [Dehalococcoidales bacterium]